MRKNYLAGALALGAVLVAGSASAADLSVVTPPAPMPGSAPVLNWTGFHVGAVGTYGWGTSDATLAGPITGNGVDISTQGALLGATVGYDYDFGNGLVAGIEADVSAGKIGGTASTTTFPATLGVYNNTWLATVRGRIGWSTTSFGNPTLWYVTGGAAFAGADRTIQNSFNTPAVATTGNYTGWTIGAGVEHAINNHWSVKAEYLYVDLGSANHVGGYSGTPDPEVTSVKLTESLFRLGVNYKF